MGKIFNQKELSSFCRRMKRGKKIIVFTNGVFDLLHRGHVEYLTEAKKLGDLLVVGLNSDVSVRRIKGDKKPIQPEADRAYLLSSFSCVDAVCLFDDDTPQKLIDLILPDVLVKGGDYQSDQIVGSDTVKNHGGKVVSIPLTEGKSTTRLIQLILERFCEKKI
jgi:rfaE bifunctional protein nucleotidyltransferase chain/domain